MPLLNETNKMQYTADGVQVTFPFSHKFFDDTDLEVYIDETLQTSGYTVEGIGSSFENGGNVVFTAAPAVGSRITIRRWIDVTQPTDYKDYAIFPADQFNDDLDRRTMVEQQIKETIGRQITGPVTDPAGVSYELPDDRAEQFLFFDAEKNVGVGQPVGVPATPFMQTVLDDPDSQTALTTLKVPGGDYLIAASDASAAWKRGADYVMGAAEDIGARINAALSAGYEIIRCSPGTFRITSAFGPSTNQSARILCCGSKKTIFNTNGSALECMTLPAAYTGRWYMEGITFQLSNFTLTTDVKVLNGVDRNFDQSYRDIEVVIELAEGNYTLRGFYKCSNLIKCLAREIACESTSPAVNGFEECGALVFCYYQFTEYDTASDSDYHRGFYTCSRLSNCRGVHSVLGDHARSIIFESCSELSSCKAEGDGVSATGIVTRVGFRYCSEMSSCSAKNFAQVGFDSCDYLSACIAEGCGIIAGTRDGFYLCNYLSSCKSLQNYGSGFGSCQHIVACYATTNTLYGFASCKQCQQNYSVSNTAGQYSSSYADQSTNACANTAAGGYNR